MLRRTPRYLTLLDRLEPWVTAIILVLATAAAVLRFLELHHAVGPAVAPTQFPAAIGPDYSPPLGFGWWSWFDQNLYLRAALAWARGDYSPGEHWYPPGYPLMGALFARLTPADPFFWPDLLCYLGSLWVFAAVAGRLLRPLPFAFGAGAALFAASSAFNKTVAMAWVIPWTTTPATLCLLLCLWGTLGFIAERRPWQAALAGFATGTALAVRPADAAVVGGLCALACLAALLANRRGAARAVGAAIAGAALPIAGFGAAYLLTTGLATDGYLAGSKAYGFEWRLLPLRWVTLMISPRPLFPEGAGLAEAFPWIIPGVAGIIAAVLTRRARQQAAHLVVAACLAADMVQFLCYRDLHPDYLWTSGVYHYFKWTLPFFALYALLLLDRLLRGPRLPALAGMMAAAVLFAWRLDVTDRTTLPLPAPQAATLPGGLSRLSDVLFLRTGGEPPMTGARRITLETAGTTFHDLSDFKVSPMPEALMVQPLRALPDAPGELRLPSSFTLATATAPVLGRQTAEFGLPCWWHPERMACQWLFILPSPALALGQTVQFGAGSDGARYIAGGMSRLDPAVSWTVARRAALTFHIPAAQSPLTLHATGLGFVPPGFSPIEIDVYVNGEPAAHWSAGGKAAEFTAPLPASGGDLWVEFATANPRSPAALSRSTPDTRLLGFELQTLRID